MGKIAAMMSAMVPMSDKISAVKIFFTPLCAFGNLIIKYSFLSI
jgi:hypothetical protein